MMSDKENLYKRTLAQSRLMKNKINRRQMIKIMAATATTASMGMGSRLASADTKGPGWYTNDKLKGKVTMFVSAGQRWELPARGV